MHISRKLSDSNLETLKYLCEPEGVPVSELEACTSGIRVFQLLEQRGVFYDHAVFASCSTFISASCQALKFL